MRARWLLAGVALTLAVAYAVVAWGQAAAERHLEQEWDGAPL